MIAVAYALLPDKSTASYETVFRELEKLEPDIFKGEFFYV